MEKRTLMPARKVKPLHRPVPPLNPAIWKDAYNYLEQHDEEILFAVIEAVDKNFSPEEIYHHWLREAGWHRIELAKRCENAARHYINITDKE